MAVARNTHRHREGVVAVELAIVSPLLILFILGLIQVGQAISVRQALLDTARGAARLATIDGTTSSEVQTHINDAMAAAGISQFSTTIEPATLSTASRGQFVTVEITSNFSQISWLPLPKFLNGVTLAGACSLPHE